MPILTVRTSHARQVVDLTDRVAALAEASQLDEGVCHVFARHTTVGMTIADLDPGTDLDYLDAFEHIVPKLEYRHPHDPAHVPSHILSALIGVTVSVPVAGGNLMLGTWQRIVLIELDGPRVREMLVSFVETV